MSNLTGPALEHIRAAERDGVAARTMPAARRLSMARKRGDRERCQGSGLSSGVPGDDGFYLGVVLAMPMVPLASPHSPGKVFK